MKKIINVADCAPQKKTKLLDIAEWSIERDFIPALRAKLQPEVQSYGDIWLDFAGFKSFRFTHEVVMREIVELLEELNMLHRVSFVNLPCQFYECLQAICSSSFCVTTRFEHK